MVEYVVPLLYLLVFNGLFVIVFKQKFEKCLPASIIMAVLLLYFGGAVNHISYGFYLYQLLCVITIILFIVLGIKRKTFLKEFATNYLSLGFAIFIIVYIVIMIFDRYIAFSYWDEFQHWGPMASQTFNLNKFYCAPEVTLVTVPKHYPPFSTLMEVLWCKLSGNYYSEAFCYRGFTILNIAMFFPLLSRLTINKAKDWLKGLLIIVLVFMIQVLCFTYYFPSIVDSIHVDGIMACLCLYGLYCVFEYKENEWFKYISIMLVTVALILVKQMGIFFYGLIGLALLIKLIIERKQVTIKQLIKYFVFAIVIPVVFYISWTKIVAANSVAVPGALEAGLSTLTSITEGASVQPLKQLVFSNFMKALYSETLLLLPFKTNYITGVILVCVILTILIIISPKDNRRDNILILSVYAIGSIVYALAMLVSYMYLFGAIEGPELAGYVRYMGTYIYFGYGIILWMMTRGIGQEKISNNIATMAITSLIVIFTVGGNIKLLIPKTSPSTFLEDYDVESLQEAIEESVESGSTVLLVTQYSNSKMTIIRYLFQDITFNSISLGDPKYDGDVYSKKLTSQEWLDTLKEYDYVYIDNFDNQFYNDYWKDFTDCDAYNENLYRIRFEGNTFTPCRITEENNCK